MKVETIILNEERNVFLTAYTQKVGGKFVNIDKRPAILILPGGGYLYCSERESDPAAFAYLKAGYQVFILNYSVAEHNQWPNPLDDVDMAIDLIRSREDWHVHTDKIAVLGFSAGGHLAAAAATMSKNRPNAAILGYAISGEDAKLCNLSAPDTTKYVDKNTCPCFIFSSRMDDVVPIQNSIDFMSALNKANIAFESHIYGYGPHGFSTADSSVHHPELLICERAANWVTDSIGWLKDMFGDFGEHGMTEPVCRTHFTGDDEEYLSARCTVGCLLEHPEAREVLGDIAKLLEANSEVKESMNKMVLRGTLNFIGVPEDMLDELNEKLGKIPNRRN